MPGKVLLINPNAIEQQVYKAAFDARRFNVLTARDGLSGMRLAMAHSPEAVVIDFMLGDMDGLDLLARLRQTIKHDTALLMLIPQLNIEQRLRCFQLGADDCVPKTTDPRELAAKLEPMLARINRARSAAGRRETGRVISFFSAKGGVGTSTIAANGGARMAQQMGVELIIVDLVLPLGSTGQLLGLVGETTLAQVTSLAPEALEQGLVRAALATRDGLGFSALLGSRRLDEAQKVRPVTIVPLFNVLRGMADYVFVDVGRSFSAISKPVLSMSEHIVVVFSPDLLTVQLTRVALESLLELDILPDRIVLLMNRAVGREGMSRHEAEGILSLPVSLTIPYEGDSFTLAANRGVPFVMKEPNAPATAMFTELARRLHESTRPTAARGPSLALR